MISKDGFTQSLQTKNPRVASIFALLAFFLIAVGGTAKADTQYTAPVIPTAVPAETEAAYQASLAAGRGGTIAKVGDSNTEMAQNLYGLGCRADLVSGSADLQATADFYKEITLPGPDTYCANTVNSFTRRSAATRGGGWSTMPLETAGSRPQSGGWFQRDTLCTDDSETVLDCEIRLTNARYTLIGGGTNDFGWGFPIAGAKDRFIDLIEAARAENSVPILQTIPAILSSTGDATYNADMATKVEEMNQAIIDAGDEEGVPVINIWRGTKDLPNKGLASDGLHFSFLDGGSQATNVSNSGIMSSLARGLFGANSRNYYVLQTLRFLDDHFDVYATPPTAFDYAFIGAATLSTSSILVGATINDTVPAGATSVITKATSPGATSPSETFVAAAGANFKSFTGLQPATTYYFRATTTYGTAPNQVTVGSSEISATTQGAPNTTVPTVVSGTDNRTLKFSSSVYGPGTTYECSLDGAAYASCAPPVSYPNLAIGSHTLAVRSYNQGTVDGTPASKTWNVTTPNVSFTAGPAEGSTTTDRNPSFTSTSTDPAVLGGIVWNLKRNGSAYDAGWSGATKSFSNLPDGKYEFTMNWQASNGNTDPTPPVRKWTIDNPPTTTITGGPAASSKTNNNDPVFTFTSDEPGSTFECRVWPGYAVTDFEPCTSPKSYTDLADSSIWTFQVRAIDPNGNVDPNTAVRQWTIDTTPPNVTITSGPAEGSTTSNKNPTFTSSSTETTIAATCTLKKNGVTIANEFCGTTKSYTGLTAGSYQFTTNHSDQAGNWDPTPPVRNWTIIP